MKIRLQHNFRDWHRIFAILPRKIGPGEYRWLEFVERRDIGITGNGSFFAIWEYRAIAPR
jgi:hypothetical protein